MRNIYEQHDCINPKHISFINIESNELEKFSELKILAKKSMYFNLFKSPAKLVVGGKIDAHYLMDQAFDTSIMDGHL